MTTIKIVSDPYKRNVTFYKLKENTGDWNEINYQSNSESELIKEEIKNNFFPYKVKQIIDILEKDYIPPASKEVLNIFFEGTSDEYDELTEVCNAYENVKLEKSVTGMENARDILPEIVQIFTEVKPIVEAHITSEEVKKQIEIDIEKFTDASNDIVPICVLGNYSSGKSTFINALIGMEILPSGDMPVTAKIYKIKQSSNDDAEISFEYQEEKIHVKIVGNESYIEGTIDNQLVSELKEMLGEIAEKTMSVKVSSCLEIINNYRKGVSDLIDIVIPFGYGPLSRANNSFVIFDTPGSNTATYKEHFVILEDAMKNLSNGVPIYVAEYNSLDSCDNESLYEKIKNISQIDSRFTMIVVNKADSANIKDDLFSKDMEEMILSQAVPRNLYAGGIYFVSSIMGLGAKTDGEFIEDHSEEIFENNERKYSDPTSKRYKTLYKYNIMPEQIKTNIIKESQSEENAILANSGLLAIEQEIVNFAEKYSAYDKCKQSDKYIGNIIEATQAEIDKNKLAREDKKEKLEQELEADKQALVKSIEDSSIDLTMNYNGSYDTTMRDYYNREIYVFELEDMKSLESKIKLSKQEEHKVSEKIEDFKSKGGDILEGLKAIGTKGAVDAAKDLGADLKETFEKAIDLQNRRTSAAKDTADELIKEVTKDFNKRIGQSSKKIDRQSRSYWEENVDLLKQDLIKIITDSDTLDDDKKEELSEIIITYENIKFNDKHVFTKDSFEKKVMFRDYLIIDFNKINIKKLSDSYNEEYVNYLEKVYQGLKTTHSDSFEAWRQKLVSKLRTNIVEYSPALSKLSLEIEHEEEIIAELEETMKVLENYSSEIRNLMDWKSI